MKEIYDFGMVLKELRCKRKMTQSDLGARLGLTKAAVSKYESGIASPPLDTLRQMAALFNVSLDYLCGTEQREKLSVYSLTDEQVAMLSQIADILRDKNRDIYPVDESEMFRLLGKLTAELTR